MCGLTQQLDLSRYKCFKCRYCNASDSFVESQNPTSLDVKMAQVMIVSYETYNMSALQPTPKEAMLESRENVVCVAKPIVIGLQGIIMTQLLVKVAAMTSSTTTRVLFCAATHNPRAQEER